MASEWSPPDISSVCSEAKTNLTTCSESGLIFLSLITKLFGYSVDNKTYSSYNPYPFDFNYDIGHEYPTTFKVTNEGSKTSNNNDGEEKNEFDFIIVGAGSAGCVIANRLTEIRNWRVLLIEAGPEEPDITSVPALASTLGASSIDWQYKSQPEEMSCRAQADQQCSLFCGRVMGGSSSINYLTFMRGNRKDYDHWAELGNPGWTYREVLPYFKKSENNLGFEATNPYYHSQNGPLSVERFDYEDKNKVMLVKAFNEMGLLTTDCNGALQIGTEITENFCKDQRRMSTNRAFIRPIRKRRNNLSIKNNCLVTKILIEPDKKIAYGVEYYHDGKYFEAYASKEVIISAGSLNSPRILMLSGIGPEQDLNVLNIPVLVNLKVGHNLQDHVTTEAMLIELTNATSTLISGEELLEEVTSFYITQYRAGPLAQVGLLDIVAFIRTEFAGKDESVPDIQVHFDGHNLKEFYADPTSY